MIAFSGFTLFVVLRRFGLSDSGPYSALLLLGAMTAAFAGGMFFKGKSGWCSTMCPLLPVQRIYGQTPLFMVANAHCQPCVGCVKNCYDFNPRAAYLADLNDADDYWSGYRRFFVGAFPGLVLAFFKVPSGSHLHILGEMALYVAVSLASFALFNAFIKTSTHTLTALYGGVAFSIFYWFVGASYGPPVIDWIARAAAIALAATWFVRTIAKEKPFLERATAAPAPASAQAQPIGAAVAALTRTGMRAVQGGAPEVTFLPDNKRVAPKPGMSLLEIAEANGLTIEAGCRMGVCGADPVAIKEGMRLHLRDLRRREGHARAPGLRREHAHGVLRARHRPGHRRPHARQARAAPHQPDARLQLRPDVKHVVVIGNGIAGVTAADHLRRRHPESRSTSSPRNRTPSTTAWASAGSSTAAPPCRGSTSTRTPGTRSADHHLAQHARPVDRPRHHEVALGTGEKLPYDR